MEKLSLEKFKDLKINKEQMRNHLGGASSRSESCSTNTSPFGDTQIDTYNDDCEDGVYVPGCTTTISNPPPRVAVPAIDVDC